MSDPNNLSKRLNDLFSDLIPADIPLPNEAETILGWIWECDAGGRYTTCSPEVEQALGVDPAEFIGKSLTTFQLVEETPGGFQSQLEQHPAQGEFIVTYHNPHKQKIPARIRYFRTTNQAGKFTGWRGFTQLIQDDTPPAANDMPRFSLTDGIAIENDQRTSVSSPYSIAGQQSWATRQTVALSATQDSPATLAVPIQLQNQLGLLEVIDDTPERRWSEDEQLLVQEVAYQLSLALENAQLFEAEQRRAREMSTLHEISIELAQQQLDLDAVLDIITRRAMELLDADGGGLWVWDEATKELVLALTYQVGDVQMGGRRLKSGEGLSGRAYAEKQLQAVDDYLVWSGLAASFADAPFHAALAAPMIWQNQVSGVLTLTRSQPGRPFSESARNLAQLLAGQAAAMLRNASLFDEIQLRVKDLTTISSVSQSIASAPLVLEELAGIIVRQFIASMGVSEASISLLTDPETLTVVSDYYLGDSDKITPFAVGTPTYLSDFPATAEALHTQKPLIIHASNENADPHELAYMRAHNCLSLIILPIVLKGESIGVIELESFEKERDFTPQELELALTLTTQAAVAFDNSRLYEEAQQRARELSRLHKASQDISAELDLSRLTEQLVAMVNDLVPVDYSGLLVFHPDPAQPPFFKVAGVDLERFQLTGMPEGKGVLSAILEGETVLLDDVSQHPRSIGLPPAHFPLKRLMGTPLMFKGELRGILLAGRSPENNRFTEADLSLFQAFATTAAITVENGRLFMESISRAEELALINRVVAQVASSLDLQESLQIITSEMGEALRVQTGFALLNPAKDILKVISDYNPDPAFPPSVGMEIPVKGNPSSEKAITTKKPVIIEDAQNDPLTAPIHETMKTLGIFVLAIYPLIIQDEVIGTLGLGIQDQGRIFTTNQVQMVETVISQVSTAIQNARLFEQIEARRKQLLTAAEVSQAASSILETHPLLIQTVNLIRDRFELYYVGIFLNDEVKHWSVLSAGTGEAGRIQLERGHKLEIGGASMIGQCIATGEARISLLAPDEVERFVNPILPNTLSEMALPLRSRGAVIGAMTIQSETANAFSDEDITALQTMSDQVANALQNASLFDQTQARASELSTLNEMSLQLSGQLNIQDIINTIYEYTARLMDAAYFFVSLYDEAEELLSFPLVIDNHNISEIPPMKKTKGLTQYVIDSHEPLLITDNVHEVIHELGLEEIIIGEPAQSWLGVPLLIGNQVLGVIVTQNVQRPRMFNQHHQDLLVAIARQSAIALQNAQLFERTNTALNETQALYNITNVASHSLQLQSMLADVLEQVLKSTGFDSGLISIYNPKTATLDLIAHQALPETLLQSLQTNGLEGTLCELVYTRQEFVSLNDLDIDSPINVQGLLELGIQSYLGVPLEVRSEILGTLCAFSNTKDTPIAAIGLMQAVGQQIGVAIENANLYEKTQSALGRTEALYDVSRSVLSVDELRDLLAAVVHSVAQQLPANRVTLITFDTRNEKVTNFIEGGSGAQHVIHVPYEELLGGLSGWVLETREAALSPKDVPDPRENEIAQQRRIETNCGAIIVAPLLHRDQIMGTMTAINLPEEPNFTQSDVDLMMAMASQVAIAIRNVELYAQTQQQLKNISALQETTSQLNAALTLDGVINTLLSHMTATAKASSASLFMLSDNTITRSGVYPRRSDDASLIGETLLLSDYPLTQQVIESKEPLTVNTADPQLQEHARDAFKASNIAVNAMIPISTPEGVIGVISVNRNSPAENFAQEEIILLHTLATQAAAAIQNARLYEEQRETAEQLRELDKLKSQFLANMSHELRTPLNSIIGFSRVIMKGIDGPVTDQQQQDLSAIYSAGQHLLNMINDILDISKIEAGKMELAFEEIDLTEIFESVLSTARGLVKDKPVKLISSTIETLPRVHADPTRIRQILLNLLSNAAKFTDEGSITLSAKQQLDSYDQPEIFISVTDTGVGIPLESQADLFEPFTQVDGSATRKTGGTGLGLSITRLLVDLHGGAINVESAPGMGSTFSFSLPLTAKDKLTILSVDSDIQVSLLYQRYLQGTDYQVITLVEPDDVKDMARQYQPFAITLDLVFPDQDGWEIFEALRADPDTQNIPVIICSLREEQEKAQVMGAAGYLLKPILSNDLRNALDRIRDISTQKAD
ncbi:MAG: GAF domain-containing protein [Anaerolineales bacterium]|nr:GAF domain-containing protein [Anaerolineales bacterium]